MNTNEALRALRASAASLPAGRRNQIMNRCDRIEVILRRCGAPTDVDTRTPEEQRVQVAEQYNTAQRIVAALIAGRTLSQRNSTEFKTTAFHSRIADARRILSRSYPEYTLCSRYTSDAETIAGRKFKIYWLEK